MFLIFVIIGYQRKFINGENFPIYGIQKVSPVQVLYHLGEGKVLEKEVKASPELAAIQKLYKIKRLMQQQPSKASATRCHK